VTDPLDALIAIGGSIVSAAFGVGVTYGAMRGRIKAAETRASTAIEQSQDALARLAVETNRSTKQDGKIDLHLERITNLRKDVDDLLATVFRSRFESNREMQAVKASRADIPRQDSDRPVPPVPTMRGRLGSRRE
jgi:molybdenum-dependent DNA-binding transcriptional regulator ModE